MEASARDPGGDACTQARVRNFRLGTLLPCPGPTRARAELLLHTL